ncbi:hypothetical protein [Streptomyces sp. SID11385]|nr:hypothetical protein [Streptomyces sp. SID11385]
MLGDEYQHVQETGVLFAASTLSRDKAPLMYGTDDGPYRWVRA